MKALSFYSHIVMLSTSVLGALLLFASMGSLPIPSVSGGGIRDWIITFLGGILGGFVVLWANTRFAHLWYMGNYTRWRLLWLVLVSIIGLYISAIFRMILLILSSAKLTSTTDIGIMVLLIFSSFALPFVLPLTTIGIGSCMGLANYILTQTHHESSQL